MDFGFACDRIERQEFARYEAIEVCEVERNSPLLFPSARAQKMSGNRGFRECRTSLDELEWQVQISHAMRRDRQLRRGAKFAGHVPICVRASHQRSIRAKEGKKSNFSPDDLVEVARSGVADFLARRKSGCRPPKHALLDATSKPAWEAPAARAESPAARGGAGAHGAHGAHVAPPPRRRDARRSASTRDAIAACCSAGARSPPDKADEARG